jgi:hypothetical protein
VTPIRLRARWQVGADSIVLQGISAAALTQSHFLL